MTEQISAEQQRILLALARQTIERRLGMAGSGDPVDPDGPFYQTEKFGSFVTLTIHADLRGCIGYIQPVAPLREQIRMCAMSAAFQDPRFQPLTVTECSDVALEISLLFPPVPVEDADDIVLGRDGLIISSGPRKGLLLPQVATDYGWDRTTFLEQTCRKAGLPQQAWRQEGTQVERFGAFVFGETDR